MQVTTKKYLELYVQIKKIKMKSINYILLFAMILTILGSCKKDEQRAIATSGTATSFSASASTIDLSKENADETVLTLDWTKADFGYQAELANTIQFDIQGGDFSNAKEVTTDAAALSKAFIGSDFNGILLSMDLPVGEAAHIIARLKTQIKSSTLTPVYSEVINLEATPFSLISYIYVPGDYQGWNPATADSLASQKSNGIYDGIIYFPDKAEANFEFKITPGKNWDNAYGDGGDGKISTTGGNFKAPGAGSYQIKADLNTLTYEMTFNQMGIIGDATLGGWDSDTDMIFDNGKQTWSVTTHLDAKELKFRKNHDWGVNYGGADGTAVLNGDNIKITEAGEYVITLDINTLTYSIVKK